MHQSPMAATRDCNSSRRVFLRGALAVGGLGALPWVSTARADEPGTARAWADLSRYIGSSVVSGTVPGAGVVVAQKGKTLFEKYWGTYQSHARRDEAFDASVVNVFFSYSKLVSATVVATVKQDGLLEWDVPVSRYLPQFTGGGKEKITLRHLLTHSAGIPAVPLKAVGTQADWDVAVKAVCDAKVDWEPGSRCQYHALTGLFVAAEAACRVTGKRWNDLCRERLFEPLGSTMSFDLPRVGEKLSVVPQLDAGAVGRLGYGGVYSSWVLGHPGGACFGTTSDMMKVLQLHLNRGQWGGKTLIERETMAEMHTVNYARQIADAAAKGKPPVHESWGLGPLLRGTGPHQGGHAWFGFGDRASPGIFGHAGISTVIGVGDPSLDLAIVFITTDKPNPDSKATELRNGVTNRVFKAVGA